MARCRICERTSRVKNSTQRKIWEEYGMCSECMKICEIVGQPNSMIFRYNNSHWA